MYIHGEYAVVMVNNGWETLRTTSSSLSVGKATYEQGRAGQGWAGLFIDWNG